jgi:hypothetical protein
VTCRSGAFAHDDAAAHNGAANVITTVGSLQLGTTHYDDGAYDTGFSPICGTPQDGNGTTIFATISFHLSGYSPGDKIIQYWNTDTIDGSHLQRFGCVVFNNGQTVSNNWCFDIQSAGPGGAYYESQATGTGTSGDGYMGNKGGCPGDEFCPANLTFGGVFIESGSSTDAPYSRLSVRHFSGHTTVRWFSSLHVLGFNVYGGRVKLNRRLVTSHTHWYTFTIPSPTIQHLHINAVLPGGFQA